MYFNIFFISNSTMTLTLCNNSDNQPDSHRLPHTHTHVITLSQAMRELHTLQTEFYIILRHRNIHGASHQTTFSMPSHINDSLTRHQMVSCIAALNDCVCCQRHTRNTTAPYIPKCELDIDMGCMCKCRAFMRNLSRAIIAS